MAPRTILITGANRGVGFAILQSLTQRTPSDYYVLVCRSKEKGLETIKRLRDLDIVSRTDVLELDITSDEGIQAAVEEVKDNYGNLDDMSSYSLEILINNAGVLGTTASPPSTLHSAYNSNFNINVTSVALTIALFLPLLRLSPTAYIINVSSKRGSMRSSMSGKFPVVRASPYCAAKAALNMVTVMYAMEKENAHIVMHVVTPGLTATDFSGHRGRDALNGAKVVVELVNAPRGKYANGFWQMEEGNTEPVVVPW
ncbi:MAG: hypothetical protein M1834_007679 [Cirrosporium novae-zelandiae]|nr:MAG: hypothetical protein M1834_007679 [Cirrosporium novae-zelandiae]